MFGVSQVKQACDRDKDGIEDDDVFSTLLTIADARVEGILCEAFDVPVSSPYPGVVTTAARAFMGELLFPSNDGCVKAADKAEERLQKRVDKGGALTQDDASDIDLETVMAQDDGDWDLDDMDAL